MNDHVERAELAQFADGTLPGPRAGVVRAHVTSCRSCMAAYADAVRFHATWLTDPDAFRLDPEFRELALAAGPAGDRARARRRSSVVAGITIVAAAAGLAVVFGWYRPREAPSLGFALDPAVLEATSRASERGLVLPGAEHDADRVRPELRSGPATSSLELDREVRRALAAYEHGAHDATSGARVVAALLASNEVETARDYAHEALRQNPRAVPLLVFAADADYRANDLAGAESLLRRAAKVAPADPVVALDLGLVLRRSGRAPQALELFARAAGSRVAGVAARARREMSTPS